MTAALLAGLAGWLATSPSSAGRVRRLWRSEPRRQTRFGTDVVAAALTPVAGVLLIGWTWGAICGLVVAPWVRSAVRRMETSSERRRDDDLRRQLPATLDLIAAALSGGHPPIVALATVADAVDDPMREVLAGVVDRLEISGDLRASLFDVPEPLEVLRRSLVRASDSGAPIAIVVEAAADDVRRDSRATRREAARSVGVKTAAPLGLCFLPAFILIGIVPTVIAVAGKAISWL